MDAGSSTIVLSTTARAVAPERLLADMARFPGPIVIDVRREEAYARAEDTLAGALRRDPEALLGWAGALDPHRPVVAVCAFGHSVSHGVAEALAARGLDAAYLAGGLAEWRAAGLPTAPKPGKPSVWVTRARPKVDRVACPWLIRRFIDPDARFVFAEPSQVLALAERIGGTAFDIPGAPYEHDGALCSFDAFVARHRPDDPALDRLARIVRGADTEAHDLHPAAGGLFAASLGLSALIADDHAQLRAAFPLYDALYLWCRDLQQEAHRWTRA